MLRLYAVELGLYPTLTREMFEDRAQQFVKRQGWGLPLTKDGLERDAYDEMNPLYVIAIGQNGSHAGSMRFLPTTGPTLLADHFSHLDPNYSLRSPFIWECTRFCLGRDRTVHTALELMTEGALLMRDMSLTTFVGLYDRPMERIYKRLGASVETLNKCIDRDGNEVMIGLWHYNEVLLAQLIERRADISSAPMRESLEYSIC